MRVDADCSGEHDFDEAAGVDGIERGRDRVRPRGAVHEFVDDEIPGRDRLGCRGRNPAQWLGSEGDAARELGAPPASIGAAAFDPLGHDHRGGRIGGEGQMPDRDGAGPAIADAVGHRDQGERGVDVVDRYPSRDAAGDEADAIADPGEPVDTEPVDEIAGPGDRARGRNERTGGGRRGLDLGHARHPVMSWTAPPVNVRRATSVKPAARKSSRSSVGAGRYAVDAGR